MTMDSMGDVHSIKMLAPLPTWIISSLESNRGVFTPLFGRGFGSETIFMGQKSSQNFNDSLSQWTLKKKLELYFPY